MLEFDDVAHALLDGFLASDFHHSIGNIHADQLIGMECPGGQNGEVARAGSYVEYAGRRESGVLLYVLDGTSSPTTIDAKRKDVIECVVRMCNLIEHPLHLLSLGAVLSVGFYLLLCVQFEVEKMRK